MMTADEIDVCCEHLDADLIRTWAQRRGECRKALRLAIGVWRFTGERTDGQTVLWLWQHMAAYDALALLVAMLEGAPVQPERVVSLSRSWVTSLQLSQRERGYNPGPRILRYEQRDA